VCRACWSAPHEDLVQALRTLGADITGDDAGYRVRGKQLQGGEVKFDSPISSQYLSALLLIAPHMTDGLTLRWTGTRLSEPYVHMTLKVMAHFGVYPFMQLDGVRVPPTRYHAAPHGISITDLEIAQKAQLKPIRPIAQNLGHRPGGDRALWSHQGQAARSILIDEAKAAKSKLILVTALSPTPAGEGKTTTSIGLQRRA
jgi:hypothetical protein